MSVKSKRSTKESLLIAFGAIIIASFTIFTTATVLQKCSQLTTKNLLYPSAWRWTNGSLF